MSLDLRKAFDSVDHGTLFEAFCHHILPDGYIPLLQHLYADQHESANRSDAFQIKRHVKEGDVLSSLLFNCILDFDIDNWIRRIVTCCILVGDPDERRTNSRYADGILTHTKKMKQC